MTYDDIVSWAQSFDLLMKSKIGQKYFADFLKSEFSDENILFWQACEELKREKNSEKVSNCPCKLHHQKPPIRRVFPLPALRHFSQCSFARHCVSSINPPLIGSTLSFPQLLCICYVPPGRFSPRHNLIGQYLHRREHVHSVHNAMSARARDFFYKRGYENWEEGNGTLLPKIHEDH